MIPAVIRYCRRQITGKAGKETTRRECLEDLSGYCRDIPAECLLRFRRKKFDQFIGMITERA